MDQPQFFDRYTLYSNPARLTDGQKDLDIAQRLLEVLAVLVQAKGAVVSKQKLLETVWKGSFVEPGSLTQSIFLLRRALGKLPDGGELIQTVFRAGYRLAPTALASVQLGTSAQPIPSTGGHGEEIEFRLLVESIEDYAIYMLDCAGSVLTWNLGAQRRTGFLSQEVIGRHFSILFLPEDVAASVPDRALATASRSGCYRGEGWRLRKNGERFWASFVINALRSPVGKLLGFGEIVHDLTDFKRHEDVLLRSDAILRRERDQLQAAAESSLDALCICEVIRDQQGDIDDFVLAYLNSNVEKMLALPKDVLLGGRVYELFPFGQAPGLFEQFKRAVTSRRPYVTELSISLQPGRKEWVRLQALPLGDGLVVTISDITVRKDAEERAAGMGRSPVTHRTNSLHGNRLEPLSPKFDT